MTELNISMVRYVLYYILGSKSRDGEFLTLIQDHSYFPSIYHFHHVWNLPVCPTWIGPKMCPTFKDCDFHNIGYCFPVWSRTVHGKPVGQCNSDHMYTCELFSDGKGKLGLRQEILHVVNHTHKKINTAYVFIKVFYLREYLSHLICKHG